MRLRARASEQKSKANSRASGIAWVVVVAVIGAVVVALTAQARDGSYLSFLAGQRDRLLVAEVAFFGVLAVELGGRSLVQEFRRRGVAHMGIALRAVLRTVSYVVLGVALVSMLSSNPALAISAGSITGLVIGFSTQSILGNVFAGMFLAIGRPFRVGDEVTVMGNTGRVLEIGIMHTRIDAGEQWILVPSTTLMSTVLLRKKSPEELAGEHADGAI